MTRTPWFMWVVWPVTIIYSSIAAGLVTVVFPGTMLRPALIMWFLIICPGMTVARFFQLETVMEWTLALALSFAIDAFVAGIVLYASWWSPLRILSILIVFCNIGALMQLVFIHPGVTAFTSKQKHVDLPNKQIDP